VDLVIGIIKEFKKDTKEFENDVPVSIFTRKLSILEGVVKYLKEERGLENKEISKLINRDVKSIWAIYNNSLRKFKGKLKVDVGSLIIPIEIFSNRNFSSTECLVSYLKDEIGLNYHKIAVLLHRNDRTVWTIYQRYKNKEGKK